MNIEPLNPREMTLEEMMFQTSYVGPSTTPGFWRIAQALLDGSIERANADELRAVVHCMAYDLFTAEITANVASQELHNAEARIETMARIQQAFETMHNASRQGKKKLRVKGAKEAIIDIEKRYREKGQPLTQETLAIELEEEGIVSQDRRNKGKRLSLRSVGRYVTELKEEGAFLPALN